MSLLDVLLQSLASIPQIYQSIFQIYRAEIASHSTKQQHKPKLFTRSIVMCFPEKSSQMRLGCSHWSLVSAWSKHWRQCARAFDRQVVQLRLASRWRLAVPKGLRENCRDVWWAPREKYKLICHRSGQHYLKSGGPTKIKCTGPNWSGGLKSPPGQCLCWGLDRCLFVWTGKKQTLFFFNSYVSLSPVCRTAQSALQVMLLSYYIGICVFHERQPDICCRRAYLQGFAKAVHMSNDRQHFDPA